MFDNLVQTLFRCLGIVVSLLCYKVFVMESFAITVGWLLALSSSCTL